MVMMMDKDVKILRKIVAEYKQEFKANKGHADHQYDYNTSLLPFQDQDGENILHLAAWHGRVELFGEIIGSLPDQLVHLLLTQQNNVFKSRNPLHVAAVNGHHRIVKLIMGFYANLDLKSEAKPWLARDSMDSTPLHVALRAGKDACAMQMVMASSVEHENNKDLEEICNMVDKYGHTLLFLALRERCSRVACHILRFAPSYNLGDTNGCTLLFARTCSEEVLELVLQRHPELIGVVDDDGYSVIPHWISYSYLWPLEYVMKNVNNFPPTLELKRHLANLSYVCDDNAGDNIFHLFAKNRMYEASKNFADIYREERAKELASVESAAHQLRRLPWLIPNKNGDSPLKLAMKNNKIKTDEYDRLKNEVSVMESVVEGKKEFVFVAIHEGCMDAAEAIWCVQCSYGWGLYPPQPRQIWHAALIFSEDAAKWMAERQPSLTSEHEEVKYVLRSASEFGAAQFIEWMLKKHQSVLKLEPMVWIEACKRGHFSTVMAFINHCPYFREICIQHKDTPLHHIKSLNYQQYDDFLKHHTILALKNFQDLNGETPLHKSIKNRNLLLTEALLKIDDVIRNIEDNDHNTAMDLLVRACRESQRWDDMCRRNGFAPWLHTNYFQDKTNLLDVRNTLLVVAALLATITFTAGFTLPGGVKSDSSGKPTLGNKAAFLVFLLADALAMCCSMLVLVFLLWSMLCDHNRSLFLIDKSMPLLLLALCSTLVAFMTGVYVVIPHKSVWASIVILGMCSIVIFSSIPWIMYKLLHLLNPVMDQRPFSDETQLMEQGEARTLQGNRSSWIQESARTSIRGRNLQQHESE